MANKIKPSDAHIKKENSFLIDQDEEDLNLDNGI